MERKSGGDVKHDLTTPSEIILMKDTEPHKIISVKRKLHHYDCNSFSADIGIKINANSGLTKGEIQEKKREGVRNIIPGVGKTTWHDWYEAFLCCSFRSNARSEYANVIKKYLSPYSRVIRDGKIIQVEREDLLPGDILVFGKGDKINADILLVDISGDDKVLVNAFLYTERVEPMVKEKIHSVGEPWDRQEIILTGCEILSGNGKGLVLAVGEQTIVGKIMKNFERKGEKEASSIALD